MEDRKAAEKEFHDKIRRVFSDQHVADTRWSPALEKTIKNDPMWKNMKYYAVERKSRSMVLDWFRAHCPGKEVLDYCCGNGEDGILIAKAGPKKVTGIDISEVSIQNCRALAQQQGVSETTEYLVRDAEKTGFDDDSFDVITEYGALHHLDLEKAMAEMARIVRPQGKIICNEALGHNPIIAAYRKLTPKLRTAWEAEHILRKPQFEIIAKYFKSIRPYYFHLFTLLAVPFRNMPFFPIALSTLELLDEIVLRIPWFKWQAWQVVFVLEGPKKNPASSENMPE